MQGIYNTVSAAADHIQSPKGVPRSLYWNLEVGRRYTYLIIIGSYYDFILYDRF